MEFGITFPKSTAPADLKAAGPQLEQQKLANAGSELTQTEAAVAPADETETFTESRRDTGNTDGRGQLVDVRV